MQHCLDVMHIEKHVCENAIGIILNIPGKSKDALTARKDLENLGIRSELAPQTDNNGKTIPPLTCYNLSRDEKRSFYATLYDLKVPKRYCSNFSNRVSMEELKLTGLMSHDCHTLIQQLLHIAIRGLLTKNVRYAITRLCFFFF